MAEQIGGWANTKASTTVGRCQRSRVQNLTLPKKSRRQLSELRDECHCAETDSDDPWPFEWSRRCTPATLVPLPPQVNQVHAAEVLKGTRWLLLKQPENLDTTRNEPARLEEPCDSTNRWPRLTTAINLGPPRPGFPQTQNPRLAPDLTNQILIFTTTILPRSFDE